MKVVIVAKTRMGSGSCIGGITFEGQSLRLIAADKDTNDQFNNEYSIGDVWNVEYKHDAHLTPPHLENIIVYNKTRCPSIDNVTQFIETHMPAVFGGPEVLFEGLAQATKAGVQYIAERTGIPSFSTTFWRPDKTLWRDDDAKRIRYRYPTADGGRTVTFVGYQEPLDEIPAGTLLRISLAHWWRPKEMIDGELRCYLQLSGWYDVQPTQTWFPDIEPRPVHETKTPGKKDTLTTIPGAEVKDPSAAEKILKRVFGYEKFRPLQQKIIDNVLNKKDTLAIMPTGSGKSICFQIPALIFSGLTVVVSPLISLMEDQVQQLKEVGVPALFLNSTLDYSEYLQGTADIKSGKVKLLYAAPETLLRPETLLLLQQVAVDCITIDEAHCISAWGHDFRPEYRQLIELRRRLPDAVCLAVTATATQRVRQDIKSSLNVHDASEFVASFDRPNLFLSVQPRTNGLSQTIAFLENHKDQSGIIYCSTRKQVDTLTRQLAKRGFSVLPYHAGLETAEREANQRRFSFEESIIMVATIAFGMGINKSNVRFILHYNLPKNIENYYQQIGRSGRDGLQSDCLLLFSTKDLRTINFFINQQQPSQQLGATQRLQALIGFCETNRCRRQPLLNYFGEDYTAGSCNMCDNCLTGQDEENLDDITVPAQKFLSCVKRTGEIFGANHIIDVLRGSRSRKVLDRGHDQLSTYNIGREFSKQGWQYLARQLIQQGLLFQDMNFGSLKLTGQSYEVLRGKKVFGLLPEKETAPAVPISRKEYDQALFDLLRHKRAQLAADANMPPYFIFSDRSLIEMASYFPQSRSAFAGIYGVGETKLEKYAGHFLPIIQDYCRDHAITEKRRQIADELQNPTSERNRSEQVANSFNDGQSISELAEELGIKESTVLNHLWKHMQNGGDIRQGDFLPHSRLSKTEQKRVQIAFESEGIDLLKPVFDALNGEISYDELRILRLHYLAQAFMPESGEEGYDSVPSSNRLAKFLKETFLRYKL